MWPGRTRHITRPPIALVNRLARRLESEGRDIINLGQAILGLPPPSSALEAVRRGIAQPGTHAYSPDPGLDAVLARTATFLRTHKHITGASPRNLMLTCGASQAFANAVFTTTNPGDEVIVFGPYYFDHVFAIQLAACTPVEVPFAKEGSRFAIDLDLVERAVTAQTKGIVLVSPGNPTGFLADTGTLERLCQLCRRHELWLLSDETYDLLTFPPGTHVSPASLDVLERVCVVGSFSKTLGLAGWRIGYLHGPADMIEEAIKVQDALVVCAPVPAQLALLAALETIDTFSSRARSELLRRRDTMTRVLEASGLFDIHPPEGGTFLLARIRSAEPSLPFCTRLLEATGIVAVPGAAFGRHGEGHVRFSFGNQPVERILEAGERIAAVR